MDFKNSFEQRKWARAVEDHNFYKHGLRTIQNYESVFAQNLRARYQIKIDKLEAEYPQLKEK